MQPMLSLALYRSGRRTGRWLSDLMAGFGQCWAIGAIFLLPGTASAAC